MAGIAKFDVECVVSDRQERKGVKDGRAWHMLFTKLMFWGGDHEEAVSVDNAMSSPLNGVPVGTKGVAGFEVESQAFGDRKRLVPVLRSFRPAATRAAASAAGFVSPLLMLVVAVLSLLCSCVVASADSVGALTVSGLPGWFGPDSFSVPLHVGDAAMNEYGEGAGSLFSGASESFVVEGVSYRNTVGLLPGGDFTVEQIYEYAPGSWDLALQLSGGAFGMSWSGDASGIVFDGSSFSISYQSFQLPEPVSGALALGFGCTLARRQRG